MAQTNDQNKTQAQLIEELQGLRQRVATLQEMVAGRRQIEETLAEERSLLRGLIDNVPDRIYAKDTQSRFIIGNVATVRRMGLASLEELVGKSDFDLLPRALAEQTYADEQTIIQSGQPIINREEPMDDPDNPTRWNLATKVPLRDNQGKIIGIVGMGREITERKQVEEALRENEEKYRTILENMEDGYYEVDIDGNLAFFNDSLCRLYGYSKDELMGMNYRQYMDDETAKAVYQVYNTVYRTGNPARAFDWQVIRKDGTRRFVEVSISLMRGPTGKPVGFRGTIRDITERKRVEEALERRALQLQTSAEVSHAASSILDPDELIQQAVDLVRERFGLYYAGLFLVDDSRKWAVLQAGTGKAGPKMVEQGHRLEVGGESMIGWCIANKQARIALDVGKEAVRFENPLLSETRSELALPLVSRGQVIGALTIQSAEEAAFSEEDIAVLQTLADQVTTAIANARLYKALAQEQYLMNALMNTIPDYIYFKDTESRFIRTTRAHAKTFGLSDPAEAIGKTDFDFFTEEHARPAYEDEQEIIRSGQPKMGMEEKETWPDAPDTWVLTSKLPLRDEQGNIVGTFGISSDITARKQAEVALAEERNLLRTLVDNLPDYVYVKNREGRFVLGNTAVVRQLGLSSPDELVGKSDFDFFPQQLAAHYHTEEQEIIQSGQGLYEHEGPTVDASKEPETRWVSTNKIPLRDAQGEVFGFVGLGRDMTEHKAAEAERDRLLTSLERRAVQLQTAAEVSRAASSILDPDELIQQAVALVRERYGLYYAGLFLVDDSGKWAVLRAGTGEAGQKMVEQGHRLEVGGESMIGWCTASAQARITQHADQDAVRLANPLLPNTRSEIALPLIARGQVIGAMTIHSEEEAAFAEEDIAALQAMAGQVANAISNARLFEQAQNALREMETTHRRYLQQAWTEYLNLLEATSYETQHPGTEPLGDRVLPEIQQAIQRQEAMVLTGQGGEGGGPSALVMPVALRGQVIGALGIHGEDGTRQWTDEEIALVEAVAERMALTAESLRLLDETQRRAAQERLVGEVTGHFRESLDVDTVLQTAVSSMRQALGITKVEARLSGEQLAQQE